MLNRSWTLAAIAAAVLALGACQEKLVGGNACPSLCPEQTLGFRDTVFLASDVIDTMVLLPGTPPIGTEAHVLLARYAQGGDSVVSVGVFRFDSVVRLYRYADTSITPIPFTSVDSSALLLQFVPPPTGQDTFYVKDSSVTFTAYNVFVNAPDLDTAAVHAKFSGTPIGSVKIRIDSLNLTKIRIPIDTAFLTTAVTTGQKVWIGVKVTNLHGARVVVESTNGADATRIQGSKPTLNYIGRAPDTLRLSTAIAVNARATAFGPAQPALGDYQLIFKGTSPVPAGLLAVGGLAQNRILVRFKFPAWLVDSTTTVVRANLELHQAPFTHFVWDSASADGDTLAMHPYALVAAPEVTDFLKMGVIVGDVTLVPMTDAALNPTFAGLDTVRLVSAGANIFDFWRARKALVQRGVVFALTTEGIDPRELLFYGLGAAPANLPRVHVSYVPHAIIGLP